MSFTKDKLVTTDIVRAGSPNAGGNAIKEITTDDTLEVEIQRDTYVNNNPSYDLPYELFVDTFTITDVMSDNVNVWLASTNTFYMYRVDNGSKRWFMSPDYNITSGAEIIAITESNDNYPPLIWDTAYGSAIPTYDYVAGTNTLKVAEGSITESKLSDEVNEKIQEALDGSVGPQGPQGDIGPVGPQGDTGADSTVAGPQGAQGEQGPQGESSLGSYIYTSSISELGGYMFTTTFNRQFNSNKVRSLLGTLFSKDGGLSNGKNIYTANGDAVLGNRALYISWASWGGWVLYDSTQNPEAPDYEYIAYNADVNTTDETIPPIHSYWEGFGAVLNNISIMGKNFSSTESPISAESLGMPSLSIDVAVGDWVGLEATKTAYGIAPTSVVWVSPAPESYEDYVNNSIRATFTELDEITFTCNIVPTNTVTISVVIGEAT